MEDRIEVVHGSGDKAGPGKPFGGQSVFEVPGSHVGLTRLAAGTVTPWHHHGACNFFGYVIQGTVVLEFGSGGKDAEQIAPGEFFRIPPHLIHRDVNGTTETVLVATVCVGPNPTSILVDGLAP